MAPSGWVSRLGVRVLHGYVYAGLYLQSVLAMCICTNESFGGKCVCPFTCLYPCIPVCTCISVGGLCVCGCTCIPLCMSVSCVLGSSSARVLCCWSVHLCLCVHM